MADKAFDTSNLQTSAGGPGFVLWVPRRCPGKGFDHRWRDPQRIACITRYEAAEPFNRSRMGHRANVERGFAH